MWNFVGGFCFFCDFWKFVGGIFGWKDVCLVDGIVEVGDDGMCIVVYLGDIVLKLLGSGVFFGIMVW